MYITEDWKKYCMLLIAIIISACGTTYNPRYLSNETYRSYSGAELPPDEISSIQMGKNVEWVQISKGEKILYRDFGKVTVLPGEYRVTWGTKFAVSASIKFSGVDSRTWGGAINLKPGRTYSIIAERTTGPGYNVFVKVEESDGKSIRNITSEIKDGGQISSQN